MSHRIVTGIHSIGANNDFTYSDHQDRAWRFNRPYSHGHISNHGLFSVLLGDVGAGCGANRHRNQFCRSGVPTGTY